MSGAKPCRYLARPVAASVASVRPWKESIIVMISFRPVAEPYFRASLIIASLASAPLLQKKTVPSKPREISFSASFGVTSL